MDELQKMCAQGESTRLEFKRELSVDVLKDLSTDIAAMANTEGGRIIIGVDDERRPVGYTPRQRHEDRNLVSNEAKNCSPPIQRPLGLSESQVLA